MKLHKNNPALMLLHKSWWWRDIFSFLWPILTLGYPKAVSTSCWLTVSISEVFDSYVLSAINYSVVLKSNNNKVTFRAGAYRLLDNTLLTISSLIPAWIYTS